MRTLARKALILSLLVGLVWLAYLLRSTQGFPEYLIPAGLVSMTLGFTLLASHILARLGASSLGLPLITGYLLAGVALGPEGLGLISLEVKAQLQVINQIALGLIALTAGGELAISRLKPRLKAIGWVSGLQTLLIFAMTSMALVVYDFATRGTPWALPLTAGLDLEHLIVMGLILGLVATANSPASTVAVVNELRARGPLTTLSLGTTVVKDVCVILLMALVLIVSQGFLDSAQGFELGMLLKVPAEVALSLLAGAFLGGILILYLRKVNKEAALFLLAMVVLVIELIPLVEQRFHLHLHFLLMFIAAGFVVENASDAGDALIQGLERSSLPVYVVFFTFSGVGLDMGSLRLLWSVALGFVVWRAALLYLTTRAGAALGGETPQIRRRAWTAFVAQAGISLGLAELVALRFPHMGAQIRTLVLAGVAINQLVGPVLFKWALRRSGEQGRADLAPD